MGLNSLVVGGTEMLGAPSCASWRRAAIERAPLTAPGPERRMRSYAYAYEAG